MQEQHRNRLWLLGEQGHEVDVEYLILVRNRYREVRETVNAALTLPPAIVLVTVQIIE
jgi:hypothetical protein